MKKFIAFIKDNYSDKSYKIYELGVNSKYPNLYCDSATTSNGFEVSTVKQCTRNFLYGDTLEEIKLEINKHIHKCKYGDGQYGDVNCPNCGYKYDLDYMNYCDDNEFSAINTRYKEQINCICGCQFRAEIDVKINWNIKKI